MSKITSRKFVISLLVTLTGIGTALANSGNAKIAIAGLIIAAASSIFYTWMEGTIDAKAVLAVTAEAIAKIEKLLEEIETSKTVAAATAEDKSAEAAEAEKGTATETETQSTT